MKQKVAVVTGGANGIGKATCRRLSKENIAIVIADIDKEKGEILARELPNCLYIQTDTSNEESVAAMVAAAGAYFGSIDILVNGAAAFVIKGIEATPEEWNKSFSVNVIGYALCIKHCIPWMKLAGKGSIVNIGSISGYIAQAEFVTYSAAKGAINAMTRSLAGDLAPYHIRVNAIHPGTVWTESNKQFHKTHLKLTREEAEHLDRQKKCHMLGRFADPEEIAEVITFLATDASSFVTAANWLVDGGYTAW